MRCIGHRAEFKVQIAGLSPLLQQGLLAALPKVSTAFHASMPDRDALPAGHTLSAASSPPQTSVQMLIALAAAEPTVERRRKQATEADRGIAALERLHRELICGNVRPEQLEVLADWSAALGVSEDERLTALAHEIDLRVRVELAKLDIQA